MPAFFNDHIYYHGAGDVLKSFRISNGHITPAPDSQGAVQFGFPGATPAVSADGHGAAHQYRHGQSRFF